MNRSSDYAQHLHVYLLILGLSKPKLKKRLGVYCA